MKLVEILARELKVWPKGADVLVQDYDGEVKGDSGPDQIKISSSGRVWLRQGSVYFSYIADIADDRLTAIVTREMWQAEREKLKPKKANAEGWIRHRGGKCPVEAGTVIEYRLRKRGVGIAAYPEHLNWGHDNHIGDIMAYRIHKTTEQPAIEPGVIHVDTPPNACEESSYVNIAEAMAYIDRYHTFVGDVSLKDAITVNIRDQHQENPLAWRDRIREIDRTVEALEEERVSLIQRLEGEGFKLIGEQSKPERLLEWQRYAIDGMKINAIKEYRALTGAGLRESKEAVEAYQDSLD